MSGDEIAIFNKKGMLAGVAVYEDKPLAITVWGDDPTTETVDGFTFAEDFIYRVWRTNAQEEFTAEVAYESGDVKYENDGVAVLKKLVVGGQGATLLNIYPNPTDGSLTLEYYLAEASAIQVWLFDVYGKELLKQLTTDLTKGKQSLKLDLSNFAAGLYICNFKSGNMTRTVKVQKY